MKTKLQKRWFESCVRTFDLVGVPYDISGTAVIRVADLEFCDFGPGTISNTREQHEYDTPEAAIMLHKFLSK